MLRGLKDRILDISSSAKGITVPGLSKNSRNAYSSKTQNTSKFKKIVITSLAAVTIALTAVSGISSAMIKTITLSDGTGATKEITTTERYVEDILAAEGIILGAKDAINIPPQTLLEDDMKIEITRAYPVKVTDNGVTKEHMTLATTPGAILEEYGYEFKDTDKIVPSLNEPITKDAHIAIIRTEEKFETASEEIPFQSTERNNANLATGKTKVVQEGKPGEKLITYKVNYENGVEVSREKVDEQIVVASIDRITEIGTMKAPAPAVIAKATPGAIQTSRSGNLAYSKVVTLNATAYDASSCGKSPSHPGYGITATGARAKYGVVAVDPRVIPLGSRLYIESSDGSYIYGTAVAADTGGAIKGNRIDLCFNTRQEALNFGRRQVKAYILK